MNWPDASGKRQALRVIQVPKLCVALSFVHLNNLDLEVGQVPGSPISFLNAYSMRFHSS
jgi:hypothetical protein